MHRKLTLMKFNNKNIIVSWPLIFIEGFFLKQPWLWNQPQLSCHIHIYAHFSIPSLIWSLENFFTIFWMVCHFPWRKRLYNKWKRISYYHQAKISLLYLKVLFIEWTFIGILELFLLIKNKNMKIFFFLNFFLHLLIF